MIPTPCPVCDGGESSALAVALHNETAARTGCRVYRVRRATTPPVPVQRPAAWLAEHFPLPER